MIFLLIWLAFLKKIWTVFANQEIVENGRVQYQLLKERGNLPQYGSCWKLGVDHLEKGCKYLGEQTQSEMALHFTNCFLKMSGHETYNCDLDKKTNLRAICISNMSDRAFHVYTEFYTHIQNICGFLQGHVWHEMIAENTMAVGNKLKETVQNQEGLLQAQIESLKLQEKMLKHSQVLENVLDDLFASFTAHQDILHLLSQTVSNLQNWIVGEMSWFDSVIFYTTSSIILFLITSSTRTSSARLVTFFLLLTNFLIERLIFSMFVFLFDDTTNMYSSLYSFIWVSRYIFMVVTVIVLIYFAFVQRDPFEKQYALLTSIHEQNNTILNILNSSAYLYCKSYVNNINETISQNKLSKQMQNDYCSSLEESNVLSDISSDSLKIHKQVHVSDKVKKKQVTGSKNTPILNQNKNHISEERYTLRSSSRCSSLEPMSKF